MPFHKHSFPVEIFQPDRMKLSGADTENISKIIRKRRSGCDENQIKTSDE